jgi:hypothetical protein
MRKLVIGRPQIVLRPQTPSFLRCSANLSLPSIATLEKTLPTEAGDLALGNGRYGQ